MRKPAPKNDTAIRQLVPTKVRLVVQSRKPQKAKDGLVTDTSYSQLPGYTRIVEVRTLREFRRLWAAIEDLIVKGGWRVERRAAAPGELPVAGPPLAGTGSSVVNP